MCVCAAVLVCIRRASGVRQRHNAHPYVQLNVSRYLTGNCVRLYRLCCVDTLISVPLELLLATPSTWRHSLSAFSFFLFRFPAPFLLSIARRQSSNIISFSLFHSIFPIVCCGSEKLKILSSTLYPLVIDVCVFDSFASRKCFPHHQSIVYLHFASQHKNQKPQNRLKSKFGALSQSPSLSLCEIKEMQWHSKNYCECEKDLSNINFHVLSIKFTNHK